jgi:Flp pilus assembly protein TadD
MPSSPRAPFDQGLFLTHFNKGKDFYDQKRFEEAERELEEAYLLRPRDQKVLNLLGLVYFKQEKYEKAEEVYRKLIAESPDAHTLFYNLGLIYFKLNRLEEAESAFLKALDLCQGDNPKINFYLGSIYERLQRYQDAIYQYRQAGANIMVRRVEDKIAAGGPGAPAAPKTAPVRPGKKDKDDTAEFKLGEIREALKRRTDETSPARPLQPVSDVLLADGALKGVREETDPLRRTDATLPPTAGPRFPEIISFPKRGGGTDQTAPALPRPEVFRFLENNLMEIDFSGKIFIKQGTIYSYSGNLTFWVKERRPGGIPALVIITGTGRLILTDKDREITFMNVADEAVYVEPLHLLACEETLTPRYASLGGAGFEFLVLEGRGMAALSVASKPLPLVVTPEMPVSVPSASVISWSGTLTPKLVEDRQLYEVMLPVGTQRSPLIRLEGAGRVLLEQAVR